MCPAAARLNDPIAHTSTMGMLAKMGGSLLVGALVGAAITALVVAAVVATVATGGLGLAAVLAIGFGVSVAMEASGLNGFIDSQVNRACDKFIPPSIEGKIVTGSPNVTFNSLPAARAAAPGALDTVACNKHAGAPPMLAQGSDNVFINSQPAARIGDMTTCGGTIAEGSADVFVGGGTLTVREINDERPWWITALGVGIGVALTLCGRGKMNLSALKSALPCLLMNMGASVAGTVVGSQIRTTMGNPVNVITGGKVLREDPDFHLHGPMALEWARFYSSHDERDGMLGRGWSVPCEVSLTLARGADGEPGTIAYCDAQGRSMAFPPVAPGQCHYSTAEGYYLICTELGQYLVESADGVFRDFGVPAPGFAGTLSLQRLEDRNGNWQALDYDDEGRLAFLRDSCRRRLAFSYSQQHPRRVAEIVLQRGAEGEQPQVLVQYRYSVHGQLSDVIDRSGRSVRRFAYRSGLMVEHSVPGGLRCHYQWEGDGASARVARHWTDDGESYEFRYLLAESRTTVRDQLGRLYQWEWNADCQPTAYTDPEGHTWRYLWDANRQLVKHMDPTGATTRFEYDERGRQVRAFNALGQVAHTEWHERLDLPRADIDAVGNRRSYQYDERGNLILTTDPEGNETEQFYDARGLPHTIRDARGGYKHIVWNARAQVVSYTDCSGKTTRFAYDAGGALARVTDMLCNATSYECDALGRVVSITAADGSVERLRYDALGRVTARVDAANRVTEYVRNARGLLVKRIDAAGRSVQFVYDQAFRPERLINENGEAYRFAYDRNDNRVEERNLDGVVKRTSYDARGLAVAVTDADGEAEALSVRFERDALGRLTGKHARALSTLYRYDQAGRLVQAQVYTDVGHQRVVHDSLAFTYNKLHQLTSETGHLGKVSHSYDELGNRSATLLPDGQTIARMHYGAGHLHHIGIDGATITDIERDDLHREIARSQGALTSSFGYDRLGRTIWQQASGPAAEALLQRKEWRYDPSGELLEKRHSRHGASRFGYDQLGRIIWAAHERKRELDRELFEWDAAANLVDSTQSGGYVRHNRVMVFEDKRFEYDLHGRLETKRIGRHTEQRFRYDGEHRLVHVETVRAGTSEHVRFDYDALGRRIRKHGQSGTSCFLWDGMQLLQEQQGQAQATYVYETGNFVPMARVDRRAAANDSDAAAANVFYFHTDVVGYPEELTAASGQLAWQAQYRTWGNTVSETWVQPDRGLLDAHCPPLAQNLRFQGQYLDRETGLHYNTFRFYDPDIGRFISPDPVQLAGGTNLYQYAPNPLTWIDPYGLTGDRFPSWMGTTQGYQRQHLIPYSLRDHLFFERTGMSINGASNMMRLPVAPGIDRNPNLGLHKNWTKEHADYNKGVLRDLNRLETRAVQENWDYRRAQQELLALQHERRAGFQTGKYTCA